MSEDQIRREREQQRRQAREERQSQAGQGQQAQESQQQGGQGQQQGQQEGQQQEQQQGQGPQGGEQRGFQGFGGARYDPESLRRGFESIMPPSISAIPLELRGEWTQRHLQAVQLKMENYLRDIVLDLSGQLDALDASYVRDLMTRISNIDPTLFQFLSMSSPAAGLGVGGLTGMTSPFSSPLGLGQGLGSPALGGLSGMGSPISRFPGASSYLGLGFGASMTPFGANMDVHMNHFELLRQVLQRQGSEQKRRVLLQDLLSRAELFYSQQFGAAYLPREMNIDARAARLQTIIQEIRHALLTVDSDQIAQTRDKLVRNYTVMIRQLSDQMIDSLHEWTFQSLRQETAPYVGLGLGTASSSTAGVWPSFAGPHPTTQSAPGATGTRIGAGLGMFAASGSMLGGYGKSVAGAWEPRVDIFDCGDTMRVIVDLAGINKEDMTVDIQDPGNRVVISGNYPDKPQGRETPIVQERIHGQFSRTITLPFSVDPKKTDALFENGILELTLTKMGASRVELQ